MSKKAKSTQLKAIFDQFKAFDFEGFFKAPGTYTEWEGLDLDEFQLAVGYIIQTYDDAFEADVFSKLPFASINALVSSLTNAVNHVPQLFAQKQQGQFQNAAAQIDNVVHQLMIYDVNYYLIVGSDIEEIKNVYESEAQKLTVNNAEVEGLKNSVKSLIEPAVSGSLSKSFSDRKSSLFYGRLAWGIATLVFAAIAVYATYTVSDAVIKSMHITNNTNLQVPVSDSPAASKTEKTPNAVAADPAPTGEASLSLILLRSIVLVPIYIGFGFAFSQYRKERDLEEEYAHKAAVATTLPNYGDLAKDDGVKDQIVSGASNVIFASPIHRVKQQEKGTDALDSVKGLFETAGKVFKRDQ